MWTESMTSASPLETIKGRKVGDLDHFAIDKEIKFANKAKKHDKIDTLVTAFAEELSHGWKEQLGAAVATPGPDHTEAVVTVTIVKVP